MCIFVLQQNSPVPSPRPAELPKNQMKNQMWTGVLGITLVEGQDLPQYGQGDIYVRFRLGDQKYKSKVGLFFKSLSLFPLLQHSFPLLLRLFSHLLFRLQIFLPGPYLLLSTSLSQQVPVSDSPPPWLTGPWRRQLIRLGKAATHFSLCFGCWASLPSFAYPACPVHLPVLVGLPPDDSMVHLSCVVVLFLCKPLCFPLCLFVCWTKLILIGSCQCLQSQSGY